MSGGRKHSYNPKEEKNQLESLKNETKNCKSVERFHRQKRPHKPTHLSNTTINLKMVMDGRKHTEDQQEAKNPVDSLKKWSCQ